MKFRMNRVAAALLLAAFTSLVLLSSCDNDNAKCCEGYTGKITNPMADSLVKRCHFLPQDSIEIWVGRYNAYQKELRTKLENRTDTKDSANAKAADMKAAMDNMSARFLMGGSVSYNNCIIKKILCDKNSIGLRVLYGIGSDNRIHIILVGIQPDYSNLYVAGEDCCDKALNKTLGAGAGDGLAGGTKGGAEFGQMP
jgi:hypothetical protein